MTFRAFVSAALLISCNAPGDKPPSGKFIGKSDCPGSVAGELVSIETARDYSTVAVERGLELGLPSTTILMKQVEKSRFSLDSSNASRSCKGHWDGSAEERYFLGCFESGSLVCMIEFQQVE